MEIREFARSVLLGGSLEEKLIVPAEFSDEQPEHSLRLPDSPARETAIRLDGGSGGPAFPRRDALRVPAERGVAMHVFAHHELMALELMAFALLELPDAPTAFRLGIADTMLEEQQHFCAYRKRAEQLGVGFGELPLSGFFWNAMHGISSPVEYVTQISMTFEQANLDFAEFYAGLFEEVGDEECAQIMHKVFEDEVGHVAFGLDWFDRLRPDGGSTWEVYREALPPRLSPSWAKGIGFSERGRRAAGLDEEFIREVRLFSRSKGRPPRVYISNPDAGLLPSFAGEPYVRPEQLAQVGRDLAPSLIFHCKKSDVLVCGRPDSDWLERLRELDVDLPEFVAPEALEENLLARGHVWSLDPWRWTAETDRLAERVGDRLMNRVSVDVDEFERWRDSFMERIRAEELAARSVPTGCGVVESATAELRVTVCGHTRRKGGAQTIVRRVADRAGSFAGYLVERPLAGLDTEAVARLHRAAGRSSVFGRMQEYAQSAHGDLRALGYRGPLMLHFLVAASDDGEPHAQLRELHAGIHMDDTAAALGKIVQRKRVAIWLHLERDRMRSAGFESGAALMTHLDAVLPMETARTMGTVRLKRGAVPTSCPHSAVHRFTLLLVGESLEVLASSLPGDLARIAR